MENIQYFYIFFLIYIYIYYHISSTHKIIMIRFIHLRLILLDRMLLQGCPVLTFTDIQLITYIRYLLNFLLRIFLHFYSFYVLKELYRIILLLFAWIFRFIWIIIIVFGKRLLRIIFVICRSIIRLIVDLGFQWKCRYHSIQFAYPMTLIEIKIVTYLRLFSYRLDITEKLL